MTIEELKEFHDNTLAKEKWEVPTVRLFTQDEVEVMLTEIQLECEENTVRWYVGRVDGKSDDVVLIDTLNEIIEQKINALKEASDA